MKVTNNAAFPVIAFCLHINRGYGEDTIIAPGETKDVVGPYLGEMGGGGCRLIIGGKIIVQETPESITGLQVTRGKSLCVLDKDRGVSVRHYLDEPERRVVAWRKRNPTPIEHPLESA